MTSPGQLGHASEGSNEPPKQAHESPRDTRRRRADRFSLPRRKRTWLGITLSLIALAGVAVAFASGSHQDTSGGTSAARGVALATPGSSKASHANQAPNASSSKTSHANQAPNASSKAKGKVPSAAQVAQSGGALSLPANMESRVIAWQSGPGGTHLAAVSRLFGDALQAGGARQYFEMKSACMQLTHSVSTAEAGPQIPVAAMQVLYGKALAELAKGAVDCQAAITTKRGGETPGTTVNAAMRRQAASELAAGATDIWRSTAEIEIASRQSH